MIHKDDGRLKLQIRVCTKGAIGPGKVALLEAVDRCGSITAAAKDLDMSYRRAWLLLDAMNRAFCEPVIDTSFGGKRGGGTKLSATGRTVLDIYRRIQVKAEAAVADELAEIAGLEANEAPDVPPSPES
ncbi:MAG: winged helix-turn-helix domain-containing protein [Alphaproteobacteria bacterium]|nr:winged helix-turn-helix domain-containing protein [Alphaproteobacteria bacterium]